MIVNVIKTGFSQALKHKRLLLIFYLTNLLFGLILMLPFRAVTGDFVGSSLTGEKLAGQMDFDFLSELFRYHPGFFDTYSSLIFVLALIYFLCVLFFSGGVFAVLVQKDAFSSALFWRGCGRYFGRFARLLLFCLPLFVIFFCLQFIETGIQRLVFGDDPYQYVVYWGAWAQFILRVVGLFFSWMVFDYARIYVVVFDERKMRRALFQSLQFVFGNIGKTLALVSVFYLAGAVVLVLYNPIADLLSAPNALVVFSLFLLQQVYMLFRTLMKLGLWSGELNLWQALHTSPVPVASGETEIGLEGAQG